jgi:acetyl esterase/lipase
VTASVQNEPNLAVRISANVQYAVHGGSPLTGTLYRPEQEAACPVVIAVHGGGWKQGSPQRYEHWGQWLASRGIAVYAIKYRLSDRADHRFPAAALDVIAAHRFIRASSATLGVDAERIFMMGDSAGAHLASLVTLAGASASFAGVEGRGGEPPPRAVIAVYGVYDLLAQWEHDQIARPRDQITEALMGFSPLDDKLAYFRASPIAHTTMQAPRTAFLVAWGMEDDVVDWASQSARFVTALKQSGQFVRPVPVPAAPHFWIDQPIEESGSFTGFLAPKLLRFLKDRL